MPPNRAAALVTDRYRVRLGSVRDDSAAQALAILDASIDLDHGRGGLARSLAAFETRAAVTIGAGAEQASALSASYLLSYLAAGGVDATGAAVEAALVSLDLAPVRSALLYRLGQGAGRGAAMTLAEAVALRVARTAVMDTAATTLSSGLDGEPGISNWRRVTSPTCCSRCAVLTERAYRASLPFFRRHPADRCTPEPVLADVTERIRRKAPTVVAP